MCGMNCSLSGVLTCLVLGGLTCIYYFRGVGGKWTRNTRQSVPPLLFTRGPNLEFTRENIIHTNIQTNNNDIIPVINNNID